MNGLVRLGTFAAGPFRYSNSPDFRAIGGTLVFTIDDGVHGIEPWVSDGTPAGTHLLRDVCPGACSSAATQLQPTSLGIYFHADDGVHGEEAWITDLTTAGTRLFADLCPGSCAGWEGSRPTFRVCSSSSAMARPRTAPSSSGRATAPRRAPCK